MSSTGAQVVKVNELEEYKRTFCRFLMGAYKSLIFNVQREYATGYETEYETEYATEYETEYETEITGSAKHHPDPRIKPRIPRPPIARNPDHRITKSLDHKNTRPPDHNRSLRGPCTSDAKHKTPSDVKSERVLCFATDMKGALQLPAVTDS